MEERIIDEEYGRGIRLKKTKDGFVDATDELAEDTPEEEVSEEALFEFPELTEDDEELATLTPEQAAELKRKRAEAMKQREEEYAAKVEKAQALLGGGDYENAEKLFGDAISLVPDHEAASVGYLRAKTADFSDPDLMIEDYEEDFEDGKDAYEEFVYDYGGGAVKQIAEQYADVFKAREKELAELAAPIEEKVLEKQAARRETLKARAKSHLIALICIALPTLALLVATIVFATQIHTRPDKLFLYVTIALAAAFAVIFFVCVWAGNRYLNTLRMLKRNEKLRSTDDGADLAELYFYRDFYRELIS